MSDRDDTSPLGGFLNRCLVVLAVGAAALALWTARQALLLGFAGVIVALVVLSLARPLRRWTGLPHGLSVSVAGLSLAGLIGLALWRSAPALVGQGLELRDQLPAALASFRERFATVLPQDLLAQGNIVETVAGTLTAWSARLAEGLTGLVLVILVGMFFAAAPGRYAGGLVRLFPPHRQGQARDALDCAATGLRSWLLGQVVAMAVVGTGVALGTWWIGLPAPLALGLIAGLLEFVPVVGPVLGAIPALLLALTMGWSMLLWTAALYLGIEQLESNLLMPMVERSVADVPPAVFLLALVAVGALFGVTGILLSGPLSVVGYVMVNRLYVAPLNGEGGISGS